MEEKIFYNNVFLRIWVVIVNFCNNFLIDIDFLVWYKFFKVDGNLNIVFEIIFLVG